MNKPTCYIFVGMIASGKSTLAKQYASKGCIIVNDDAIVNLIHGGEYKLYNKTLKPLYKAIESSVFMIAANLRHSVVVDRGLNVSKEARKRWLGLAKSFDYNLEAVVFPVTKTAEAYAYNRFIYDSRGNSLEHWIEAAKRHLASWEEPTISEGFDSVVYYKDGL